MRYAIGTPGTRRPRPPEYRQRAIGSAGERLVHTEEVTGSIPVSPTRLTARFQPRSRAFLIFRQQQTAATRSSWPARTGWSRPTSAWRGVPPGPGAHRDDAHRNDRTRAAPVA